MTRTFIARRVKMEYLEILEEKNHKRLKPKTKNAKATGLKSTFVVEDAVLMTSFGKGNEAVLEKEIIGDKITEINQKTRLQVMPAEKHFDVKGNGKKSRVYASKGAGNVVGNDIIGCKDVLEKRYFGRTFGDNIHIQLIYNILDIEKILTIHINDIVYSLDNLQRKDGFEADDFVGYMSLKNSYEVFCNPEVKYETNDSRYSNIKAQHNTFAKYKLNPRLAYFDCITYDKENNIEEKKLYYMLAILGEIRQFCAHSKNYDALYTMEKELNDEAKQVLNNLYEKQVSSINNGFVKNNEKNMIILFNLLGIRDNSKKVELAKKYYDFAIKKAFKNIGFSIKKLREQIVELYAQELKEDEFNSIRNAKRLSKNFDGDVWC